MPLEIERKFLIQSDAWRAALTSPGTPLVQGYLNREPERTVRVRIAGDGAFLTVKGKPTGISRTEIEFPISLADAQALLPLCHGPLVEKTRHLIQHDGMTWEVDEFHGQNAGLVIAEIELPAEDTPFSLPPWAGPEVSHLRRYSNSNLSVYPYEDWTPQERNA